MGYNTQIPYVDSSWNFLRGCTRKNPGCRHCYAERPTRSEPTIHSFPYLLNQSWLVASVSL